jgi:methanogenic corrinoid protein MtbC1
MLNSMIPLIMRSSDDRGKGRHPIRVVALRTGLSPSVLRAWERRYSVVTPSRSDGGQRLYSDADIERLSLLNRATQAGRAISRVATLSTAELKGLVDEDEAALRADVTRLGPTNSGARIASVVDHAALDEAMAAVEAMDGGRLETIVKRATVDLGATGLIERLLAPLLRRIGDRWQEGVLRPRHEHLATAVLRNVITWMTEAVEAPNEAFCIVIGTPSGERHEIGAMLAAAAAASEGWRVVYLGADIPVEDVVGAVRDVKADAVGLSFINAADAGRWGRFVAQLRQQLPDDVSLILGGASATRLGVVLDRAGVIRVRDLPEFRSVLRSIRTPVSAGSNR